MTAAAIQFMPDKVPMHFDLNGNADRYGSKYENFLLPAILIAFTALWMGLAAHFRKKASENDDKQSAEAGANARVLDILALCEAVMFSVLQYFFLYKIIVESGGGVAYVEIDAMKVSALLLSIMFIVAGVIMPKTKPNGTVGLRIKWSMLNDTTWAKSNRFAGYAMVAAGVLSLITSLLLKSGAAATVMLLVYLTAVIIVSSVYAKRVYDEEKAKEEK